MRGTNRCKAGVIAVVTGLIVALGSVPIPLDDAEASQRRTVRLKVGDNFQRAVRNNPPGTRFVIARGVHRMQRVRPKNRMVFVGERGAVMSGARRLRRFSREGNLWVATGQRQQGYRHPCGYPRGCWKDGHERDNYPEELFIDGRRMRHVSSKSRVRPGRWFFDYGNNRIYIGDDPAGRRVETSVTDHAFTGRAAGVVIANLTIRHYANPAQTGAIHARHTRNWTIRRVNASQNHAVGIHAGPGTRLLHSRMAYNGQMGLRGSGRLPDGTYGPPMVIRNNRIHHNRQLGYNWGWEGGAMKILAAKGTVFRNNWVHHNRGPGIWFDHDNRDTTIVSNRVTRNEATGIFYEVSPGPARIRWNTVRHNGKGLPGALGAGIRIANSSGVRVVGNAVDSNERGIMLTMENRHSETANVKVRNNDIRMRTGTTGLVDETGNDAYYRSKGNVFEGNTYRLDKRDARRFSWTGRWNGGHRWSQWREFGNDREGGLRGVRSAPSLPNGAGGFQRKSYGPGAVRAGDVRRAGPPEPVVVPVETRYFLRRHTCEEGTDATTLSVQNSHDEGNRCGELDAGAPNEAISAAGDEPISHRWVAADGVPFVLDGTKAIQGRITVGSAMSLPDDLGGLNAGEARLRLVLAGTHNGETRTLGDTTIEYTVTPEKDSYTLEFSFPAVTGLHEARFDSLVLTTTMRGPVLLHGSYELNDPASFVKITQLVTR